MDMTQDMWVVVAILVVAIFLFVTERLRVDIVALGVVLALTLTEILTPSEAIAGFSSTAVITIAALFIVGGAVLQTGLAAMIGQRILRVAGTDELKLTAVIMIAVALLSGVMSDTGTVAVLMPAIIGVALSAKISPSKLLIPLSFGSLLGGAMTLIGTPPNIIVSDLLREENIRLAEQGLDNVYRTFEFFDYTPVGILLLIAGIAFMLTIGRRILPDYGSKEEQQQLESPEELVELYQLAEKVGYLRVRSKSPLKDKTIGESRLRRDYGLNVIEVLHPEGAIPVASFGERQLTIQSTARQHVFPTANTVLRQDDVIIVQGEEANINRAVEELVLELQENPETGNEALVNRQRGVAEVVLPPRSSLIGRTLRETRFALSYNLSILDIRRPGTTNLDTQTTRLEFGDTLLVQGLWHDIMALRKNRIDFVLLGQPETMLDALNSRRAPVAALVLGAMLVVLIMDALPLVTTALLAALAMVLTRCLTMDEAYDAIDWKSLVLIAGMLPMATALNKVGLVNETALQVTEALGGSGPTVVLGGLFLLTAFFTQVLSNTATAVLVAPIALQIATEMEVAPYGFLMGVAIAASMAFASPVASPVNTLVLGAGNYRFVDYIKIGVPMLVIMLIITLIAVPIVFPFDPMTVPVP
jgi:di/tricarboxylate transporter